jgi:hypothetical protein
MKRDLFLPINSAFSTLSAKTFLLFVIFLGSMHTLRAQTEAQEQYGGDLQIIRVQPLNGAAQRAVPEGILAVDPNAVYSNVTTFAGSGISNGGSGTVSGNIITRMVGDDLTLIGTPPFTITAYRFSVGNLGTTVTSARPRVRFYADNAGLPGTYISGNTFNAVNFAAGSVTTLTATLATPFVINTNNIWAAVVFDNNTGATGATLAQMDLLAEGIYTPVDLGSSTDNIFRTTAFPATGSFVSNNPAGALLNFTGMPVANLGFELVRAAPAPVEMTRFTVRSVQQTALLEWETATEINNRGFQIEVSSEPSKAEAWKILGFVNGKGKAATYSFTDDLIGRNADNGTIYYRLRQMDIDGKETVSKVVALASQSTRKLKVYPTLVANVLTIEAETTATGEAYDFYIVNLLGQQVMAGKVTQRLDVSALPQGTYILNVGTERAKFIKQ